VSRAPAASDAIPVVASMTFTPTDARSPKMMFHVWPRSRERRERSSTMTALNAFFVAWARSFWSPGRAWLAPDIAAS